MSTHVSSFPSSSPDNSLSDTALIPTTATRMLADIALLAPGISSRAAQFETARRIPLDLIGELKLEVRR